MVRLAMRFFIPKAFFHFTSFLGLSQEGFEE
jgi:hypothetical protein